MQIYGIVLRPPSLIKHNKFYSFCRSFFRNVILKQKFKTGWMVFFDKEFKDSLNKMHGLVAPTKFKERREVPWALIDMGHKIVYPKYVEKLMNDDSIVLPPIKVVVNNGRYLIVDGNHRLNPLIKRAKQVGSETITCDVLF